MLLVDERIGSADLAPALADMGLPVEVTHLEFGDVAFTGRGNEDAAVEVGIELKKLPDLVTSLRDGRLSGHQVPGLCATYDYRWLLIEGTFKPGDRGEVLVPQRRGIWAPLKGGMTVAELEKRVLSLQLLRGLHVRHSSARLTTLHFLASLYRWFTDRSMDDHTTHLLEHQAEGFLEVNDFRSVVKKLPHIGHKVSLAVEQYFEGSLEAAFAGTVEDWADIVTFDKQGRPKRLGRTAAQDIKRFIRGEK